jgi:hypothetical protein
MRSWLADLERSRSVDLDEAEVRRAILHLESLLPDTDLDEAVDIVERSGLVVTDEFIALYERRFAAV